MPFRIICFWTILWLFTPAVLVAQSYEVLNDRIIRLNNYWEFDSLSPGYTFTTSWEYVRSEVFAGSNTLVLVEATPDIRTELNVLVDQTALQVLRAYATILTPPIEHHLATYSNSLELIPRTVNATDSSRFLGLGASAGMVVEDPSQRWSRVQYQYVTYVGIRQVTVPAGTFECVAFYVDEVWSYNTNWYGQARRYYYMSPIVGPVLLDYEVWGYNPLGVLVSHEIVEHRLRTFRSALPDLSVVQGAFSPNVARVGDTMTVTWREYCAYLATNTFHATDVYLSTDTVFTINDIRLVDGKQIPPLGANQFYDAADFPFVPATLTPGQYYVGVVVDVFNVIDELDEFNNVYLLGGLLTIETAPDLLVAGASYTPATLRAGETLTVSWRETCLYRSSGWGHATDILLSTDPVIGADDLRLVAARRMPALAPGQAFDATEAAAIPVSLASGQYYVAIAVDVFNEVDEVNEANNIFVIPQPVVVEGLPDLRVADGLFTPGVVAPGETLTINATIQNAGGGTAPSNWTHIYLSTDLALDLTDFALATGILVPPLAPQADYTINASALVPVGFAEQAYYVIVVCDVNGAIEEPDELNNALFLSPPVVVGRPDLQVTVGTYSPAIVLPNQPIAVQANVTNVGPHIAGANWVEMYLSSDPTITRSDILLGGGHRVSDLATAAVFTINDNPTIPAATPPGQYYVGVLCDAIDEVDESIEINNTLVMLGRLTVTTPPDLRCDNWNFAPSVVQAGDPLALGGYIVNTGGFATGGGFWVEFMVSPNPDFSSPRYLLCQSVHITGLQPGETYPLNSLVRTVLQDVPPGAYTFGVHIDRLNEVAEGDESNNVTWISDRRLHVGQATRASHWRLYR